MCQKCPGPSRNEHGLVAVTVGAPWYQSAAMRAWLVSIVIAILVAAACSSDADDEPGSVSRAGAPGNEGGGAGEAGDVGGANAGASIGFVAGGGQAGESAEPAITLRFVNALFGCKSPQPGNLDYELYPFDPYIVDVYVQGNAEPLFVGIPPTGVSSASAPVALNTDETGLRFELRAAGSSPRDPALLVSNEVQTSKLSPSSTLIAVGDPGPNARSAGERATLLTIPQGETGQLGKPHLRFVAATHQSHIEVRAGENPEQKPEKLAQYTSTPGLGIELGTAPLRLSISGDQARPIFGTEAIFSLEPAMLAHTRAAVLIVTGLGSLRPPDAPLGLSLLLVPEEPGQPALQVLQDPMIGFVNALRTVGGPGPSVNVAAGMRGLATELAYGSAPQFSALSPHNTEPFRAEEAGSATPLLKVEPVTLQAGKRYLGLLSGSVQTDAAAPLPTLSFVAEEFAIDPAQRRVRPVHVLSGVGAVELGSWNGEGGAPNTAFVPSLGPVGYLQPSKPEGLVFQIAGESAQSDAGAGTWGLRNAATSETRVAQEGLLHEPSFLVLVGDWSEQTVTYFQIAPRKPGWRLQQGTLGAP